MALSFLAFRQRGPTACQRGLLYTTAVVALNRAVAVALAQTPDDGLRLLDDELLASELDAYHLYHAARADLLRRAGRHDDAATAYRRALELTTHDVERAYLERRLRETTATN